MKRLIATVGVVTLLLTGCSTGLSSQKQAEYYNMKKAQQDMSYKIDTAKYENAILFLVSANVVDKEFIKTNKEKFKDIIDEGIFIKLESAVPTEEKNKGLEDFSNDDNAQGPKDSAPSADKQYPIYGGHYEVTGYGTKEESEHSMEDFKKIPDNIIKSTGVYKDTIVCRIDSKYTGEYMLRVTVQNNKITDFRVFR